MFEVDDPILKKLAEKYHPIIIDSSDTAIVRDWLKSQKTNEIELFLNSFLQTLKQKHPAREILLRQELSRRKKPAPNRVQQIIDLAKGNWIIAGVIVLVMAAGAVKGSLDKVCSLAPHLSLICSDGVKIPDIKNMTLEEFLKTK